jgi:hypothetical protein
MRRSVADIRGILLTHVGPGELADQRLFAITDDHERRLTSLERKRRRRAG